MRTTRLITTPLAALLAAAAVGGPAASAAVDCPYQPYGCYAGQSTIAGSKRSDPATANVYVPPAELFAGSATTQAAGPPTWPANPKPIRRPHAVVNASPAGLDWGSAGIGAAAVVGAFAITLTGIVGLHRRRTADVDP